jgi:hypothetical protein
VNVLQLRLRQSNERRVDLVANLIEHRSGDADAAGFGQWLDAGGDVHAIAEDVAVPDFDVAEMEANAQPDTVVRLRR